MCVSHVWASLGSVAGASRERSRYDIPVTYRQLQEMGMAGLARRLARQRHHLMAYRICQATGTCPDEVRDLAFTLSLLFLVPKLASPDS